MHIKSIIIRESKLDVLRQSQECIIISLPKALQLDYLVYLCTLKACFQTHCLRSCPSKPEVVVRVVESQLAAYPRTVGCWRLTYSGSFLEFTEVDINNTVFIFYPQYLQYTFSSRAILYYLLLSFPHLCKNSIGHKLHVSGKIKK